jgi:hypothetical protein
MKCYRVPHTLEDQPEQLHPTVRFNSPSPRTLKYKGKLRPRT